jgi:hypothetical protein
MQTITNPIEQRLPSGQRLHDGQDGGLDVANEQGVADGRRRCCCCCCCHGGCGRRQLGFVLGCVATRLAAWAVLRQQTPSRRQLLLDQGSSTGALLPERRRRRRRSPLWPRHATMVVRYDSSQRWDNGTADLSTRESRIAYAGLMHPLSTTSKIKIFSTREQTMTNERQILVRPILATLVVTRTPTSSLA